MQTYRIGVTRLYFLFSFNYRGSEVIRDLEVVNENVMFIYIMAM